MLILTIKFVLPLIFLIAPLSVMIHELGHILGARIVKANYIRLSIGQGKKIYSFSNKSFEITIRSLYFLGGNSISERDIPYKTKDIIIITILGPLINIIFGILFYAGYIVYFCDFILLFSLFNLWLGVVNLIPFKYKGKQSDGYIVFKRAIKHGKVK